jgi:hypothetical protein
VSSYVVTLCGVVVGYHRLTGPRCLHLQDEVDKDLWNVGILPQHVYTHLITFVFKKTAQHIAEIPPTATAVMTQSVQRLGYGLNDRGSRVRFPAGAGNFSLHRRVHNSSGAHPTSYPTGTRGSFPGGKAAGA